MAKIPTFSGGPGISVVISGVDDFSSTFNLAQSEAKKTGEAFNDFGGKTDDVVGRVKILGRNIDFLNLRFIATRLSVIALAYALVRYVSEAYKMAMESETTQKNLAKEIFLINEHKKATDESKTSIGEMWIKFKAYNIALAEESRLRQEAITTLLSTEEGRRLGLTQRTEEIEKIVKTNLELYNLNNIRAMEADQIAKHNLEMEKSISVSNNIIQSIQDEMTMRDAEINGTTELTALEIRHRKQREENDAQLKASNATEAESAASKTNLIAIQNQDVESLKAEIEWREKHKKALEDELTPAEQLKEKLQKLVEAGTRFQPVAGGKFVETTTGQIITKEQVVILQTGGEEAKTLMDELREKAGLVDTSLGDAEVATEKLGETVGIVTDNIRSAFVGEKGKGGVKGAVDDTSTAVDDTTTAVDSLSKIDLSNQVTSFKNLADEAIRLNSTGIASKLIALESQRIQAPITMAQIEASKEVRLAEIKTQKVKDFIVRPGQSPIQIDPQDTVMGFRGNMPIGTTIQKVDIIIQGSGLNAREIAREIQERLSAIGRPMVGV